MYLSSGQLEKLSELYLDIAKGAILASLIAPAVGQLSGMINVMRGLFIGLIFAYLSLKAVELKEGKI